MNVKKQRDAITPAFYYKKTKQLTVIILKRL